MNVAQVELGKGGGRRERESQAERFQDAQKEISGLLVLALEKLAILSPPLKNITKSFQLSL